MNYRVRVGELVALSSEGWKEEKGGFGAALHSRRGRE